jgi:hypothetical protein
MSAHPAQVLNSLGLERLTYPFLAKPFTRDELFAKVEEAVRHVPPPFVPAEIPLLRPRQQT